MSSLHLTRPAGNSRPRAISPSAAACIDLAERFGRRYRVEHEEAYSAQYGPRARVNDPWLKIIPCRAGHICPWGGSTLAAVTSTVGPIARKLMALPGATIWQDGADGATVLFDVAKLPQVAKLMHPRRARQLNLSPAERAERGRRLARGRKTTPEAIVGFAPGPRPATQSTLFDLEAIPTGSAVLIPSGNYSHS